MPNLSLKILIKFSAVMNPTFVANSLILIFVRFSRMSWQSDYVFCGRTARVPYPWL